MIKYFVLFLLFTLSLEAQRTVEVDLRKQRIYAKENGRVIFMGAISSGKRNHRTPKGTFRILGKNRFHRSNIYPKPRGGAKMPYMQRLTYSGIAIHQGYLPGYPASHGCIRVSRRTAQRLWRWTKIGTKVILHNGGKHQKYDKKKYIKKKNYQKKRRYVKRKKYNNRKRKYNNRKRKYVKRYKKRRASEIYIRIHR